MSPNLAPSNELASSFFQLFDEASVNKLARESGFLQRQRKLDVFRFLVALVLATVGPQRRSYKQLVADMHTAGATPLTPQAVAGHFTLAAAALLLLLLRRPLALAAQRSQTQPAFVPDWLRSFPQVWATDSSVMSLPAPLAEVFPGSGGASSSAALKLHLSLDVLNPQLRAFRFTKARTPELWPQAAEQGPPGILHLFDKGFGQDRELLRKIHRAEQFYVTPLWLPMPLYDEQGRRIDVEELCRAYAQVGHMDLLVFLSDPRTAGPYQEVRVRLVGVRIPPEVAAARRRRLRKEARAKGHQVQTRTLRLQDWVLLLTNVPKARLTSEQVFACYRLRWQVELLFRRWKSLYGLRAPGYKKVEALYCHLLATLVAAALMTLIYGVLYRQWHPDQEPEPSLEVAAALLLRQGPALLLALAGTGDPAFRFHLLERILEGILQLSHMQKRRRQSSRRRLLDSRLARPRRLNKQAA